MNTKQNLVQPSEGVIINDLRLTTKEGFQLYAGFGRRHIINPLIKQWINNCVLHIVIPKPHGYHKYYLTGSHYLLARFNTPATNVSNSSRTA